MPVGTEMASVAIAKNVTEKEFMPTVNMWCAQTSSPTKPRQDRSQPPSSGNQISASGKRPVRLQYCSERQEVRGCRPLDARKSKRNAARESAEPPAKGAKEMSAYKLWSESILAAVEGGIWLRDHRGHNRT